MLNQAYFDAIDTLVHECQSVKGLDIPKPITIYCTAILADKLDKPLWEPQPNWAERYLTMRSAQDAKDLGDTALWAVGICPTYLTRRGMSRSYYVQIGQGAYSKAADELNQELYMLLSTHFLYISEFLKQCVSIQNDYVPVMRSTVSST